MPGAMHRLRQAQLGGRTYGDVARHLGRRQPGGVGHDCVAAFLSSHLVAHYLFVEVHGAGIAAAGAGFGRDADIGAVGDPDGGDAQRATQLDGQAGAPDMVAARR